MSDKPVFITGSTPEPELIYAYKGEVEKLRAENERLRADNARLLELIETGIALLNHFGHKANASAIRRALEGMSAEHDWFFYERLKCECCRRCGFVRRADGKNRPCPGFVGLRSDEGEKGMNPYTIEELVRFLRHFWEKAEGIHYGHEHEVMRCAADMLERLQAQNNEENARLRADAVLFAEAQRKTNQMIERLRAAISAEPVLNDEQKEQLTTGYGAIMHPVDLVILGMRTAVGNIRRSLDGEKG